jgi:hypothetical protein
VEAQGGGIIREERNGPGKGCVAEKTLHAVIYIIENREV